jgi:hypothetical protein
MLQSARDLNVPCQPKRSKTLILVCELNACWKKHCLSAHAVGL